MPYSLLWTVIVVLLAIWSTGVWMLHALLVWSMSGAGALADQAQQLGSVNLPSWLPPWLPPEWAPWLQDVATGLLPMLASALAMLPSAASWLGPLAWLVWAIGLLILVAVAALGQTMIWTTRKAARA
ncbi:hypothetical protein HUU62_20160 [Rhodoferax sp. 4810]|nr:hypothetical protein [Rhodoferax jenense]